ncbi:molecular chaperone DnaJ [Aestuariivirga litoralis]|uniref:Molecular chaperone DnaJ n=1 Tax=Aestuariivirga litoralis TaxID=2650924 RepID=A0A2W2BT92_9HYPH|nr:J domain-containing protein [Aestuariivirga litoralis]PZF78907.1 molecular chaperone DnaJ [Aestuariivirga litoralis]
MKLDSKYFDKIRVKPSTDKKKAAETIPQCDWPDCPRPGRHKAPMGRGHEGKFYNYCTEHVQEYNKSYNYFQGMKDDEMQEFQRNARLGERPTWKLGQNATPNASAVRRRGAQLRDDPFGLAAKAGKQPGRHPSGRALRSTELKALQTLNLDDTATPEQVKTQYKTLVKRLHPDANNGSRANEDTLKAVIQAYDHLRSSGFC